MKYIAMLLLLTGCSFFELPKTTEPKSANTKFEILGEPVHVYEIDGCEYIGWAIGGHSGVLTHKGNCRYCAERAKRN